MSPAQARQPLLLGVLSSNWALFWVKASTSHRHGKLHRLTTPRHQLTRLSPSSNGLLNIHDLRKPSETCSSVVVHPDGIASASFQAHSGIMSTISPLQPSSSGVNIELGLYRSTTSRTTCVSTDTLPFDLMPTGEEGSRRTSKPYTVIHNLRPYLGVGYGSRIYLRGAGVGTGEDTDSGSYSFLRSQAKYRS